MMRLVYLAFQIHTLKAVNQILVGRKLDASHLYIVILNILRINVRRTFQAQTEIADSFQMHCISVAQVLIKLIVQGRDDSCHIGWRGGTFLAYRFTDFTGGHYIFGNHFCMLLRYGNSLLYRILKQIKFYSHNRFSYIVIILFLKTLIQKYLDTLLSRSRLERDETSARTCQDLVTYVSR